MPSDAETLHSHSVHLWILAMLSYGGGDTVTSVVGFHTKTVSEIGLLARIAYETAGIGGFLSLKLSLCTLSLVTWYVLDTSERVAIPIGLIVIGSGVTVWNVAMLCLSTTYS